MLYPDLLSVNFKHSVNEEALNELFWVFFPKSMWEKLAVGSNDALTIAINSKEIAENRGNLISVCLNCSYFSYYIFLVVNVLDFNSRPN